MGKGLDLEMIVSGGQRGADLAGLMAARTLGLKTGGIAPKGWRVKTYAGGDDFDPSLRAFGLVEHESPEYEPRTVQNVMISDATLWMGFEASSGFNLNQKATTEAKKPFLRNPDRVEFVDWLKDFKIIRLNVAGSVSSRFNPDIFDTTYLHLVRSIGPLL